MRKNRLRRWMTWLLALAVLFTVGDMLLSRFMASAHAHGNLTGKLEQVFGRRVEVGQFGFRWLPSPGIVANQVTIGEDPRFGNEYFLRAESVVASPRWGALLAGRLEIGTLEFSQPSLNLVRNPDGKWNVESWLPPASANRASTGLVNPRAPRVAARLFRIVIDGGRINFNQGVDRRPFALVDLTGSVEQESPGVWNISLEASPQRATVHLQESGRFRLAGHISGTSARLQPADLALTWSDASLTDALRLVMGRDPGIRGELQLRLTAKTKQISATAFISPAAWEFNLIASVHGLHRWDMASRGDNPQVTIQAEAAWNAGASLVDLSKLMVQTPHSDISGAGSVDWSRKILPDFNLTTSGIAFDELISAYRSFQPGVAEGLTGAGYFGGEIHLSGWPLQIKTGELGSDGVLMNMAGSPWAESTPIHLKVDGTRIELSPVTWTVGGSEIGVSRAFEQPPPSRSDGERVTVAARLTPPRSRGTRTAAPPIWEYGLDLNGEFNHVEGILAAVRALGRPINNGWDAKGGLDARLNWQWKKGERFPRPTGQITPHGFTLVLPALNQPIEITDAKIELMPGERRITVVKASALGAHWQGTISKRFAPPWYSPLEKSKRIEINSPVWEFDLTADRIDAVELDRWLGPRERPGWVARLFSSQGSGSSQLFPAGMLAEFRALGTLHVGELAVAPLMAQNVRAGADINGRDREINIRDLQADAFGGRLAAGLVDAKLSSDPSYKIQVQFENVDAAQVSRMVPALKERVTGNLGGGVTVEAHGIGRENLLATMKTSGLVWLRPGAIRDLSLPAARETSSDPAGQFRYAGAKFSSSNRKIQLDDLVLRTPFDEFQGSGQVDFARRIEVTLFRRPLAGPGQLNADRPLPPASRVIHVTGLVEAPQVTSEPVPVVSQAAPRQPPPQPAVRPVRH